MLHSSGGTFQTFGGLLQICRGLLQTLDGILHSFGGLADWIPGRIKLHIDARLGVVPLLHEPTARAVLAEQRDQFLELIKGQISKTPANFEIFSFAVIKVHLEKFACKIYRDTRTAAHQTRQRTNRKRGQSQVYSMLR